jgi:hypothetical protein
MRSSSGPGRHDDFGSVAEFLDLGVLVHTAIDADGLHFGVPAETSEGFTRLFCQFPCRCNDQLGQAFAVLTAGAAG